MIKQYKVYLWEKGRWSLLCEIHATSRPKAWEHFEAFYMNAFYFTDSLIQSLKRRCKWKFNRANNVYMETQIMLHEFVAQKEEHRI